MAYQSHFARDRAATVPLSWVSLAAPGDRLGAGRTLREAWSNLLGASVPSIAGQRAGDPAGRGAALARARRLGAARAATGRVFGQAWRGLRDALGLPTDTVGAMSLLPPRGRTSLQRVFTGADA